MTINELLAKFPDAKRSGDGWSACCPAHDDHTPSLVFGETKAGGLWLKCFAGCANESICESINISPRDLMPNSKAARQKHSPNSQNADPPSASKDNGSAKSEIVATYDYCDEAGTLLFQVVRLNPKSFRQRRPTGYKLKRDENGGTVKEHKWTWNVKGVRFLPYRLPELLAYSELVVFVVEGEKDVDKLAQIGVIATCNAGGAGKWKAEHAEFLRGRLVVILPDNDDAGRKHAQLVAQSLQGIAKEVKIVELPGLPAKGDVSDWIAAGGTKDELQRLVEESQQWVQSEASAIEKSKVRPDNRDCIECTPDEHIVIDESIQALAKEPSLFVRGGVLVQLVQNIGNEDGIKRNGDLPHLRAIEVANIRELLSKRVYFYKESLVDGEVIEKQQHPPPYCSSAIATRGYWPGMRTISGITTVPVLRADGTILDKEGYDPVSGLLYAPYQDFPTIKENPTLEDALKAVNRLLEPVSDFPFKGMEHISAWLAGLFTILTRHAFDGPAPLFLIEANTRGSGKSMLADIIGEIATGRAMPRMTCPRDDDESRKRITSLAIAGDQVILLDNLAGALGSASLDAALTGTEWSDRRLGKSEMVRLPLKAVWFATGNNVPVIEDSPRRIIHVLLESPEERPEERTGFKFPSLMAHVRSHRAQYLVDALTCIRAFIVAGKPCTQNTAFGSFEDWARIVRDCICWLGLPDPTITRNELLSRNDRSADILTGLIQGLIQADHNRIGLTSAEILKLIESESVEYEILRAAILDACDNGSRRISIRMIGNVLGRYRGRVCSGHAIDCIKPNGTAKWFVRNVIPNRSKFEQPEQPEQANSEVLPINANPCDAKSGSGCSGGSLFGPTEPDHP